MGRWQGSLCSFRASTYKALGKPRHSPFFFFRPCLGFDRGYGGALYTPSIPLETGLGDDHQQVARSDFATRWSSSPELNVFCFGITFCFGINVLSQSIHSSDPVFAHGQLYVAMSRVSGRHALRVAARLTADEDPMDDGVSNVVWVEILS